MSCRRRGYLKVGEAASLLGVAPVTVRAYCARGQLEAYRIGRGSVAHRRLPYRQVEALAAELGRALPPPEWLDERTLDQEQVATYLGLSLRYLRDEGWLEPGRKLTLDELRALEGAIYGRTGRESEAAVMEHMHGMGRGMGRGRMWERRGERFQGMGRGCGPGWMRSLSTAEWEEADELTLRSWKRHLEALQADIRDRLQQLEKLLARAKTSTDEN